MSSFQPDILYKRLTYCDTFTLDVTTGSYTVHNMNANSAWDPNGTGTGHQPLGYDMICQMYRRYCVMKSRLTVVPFSPEPESAVNATWLAVYPTPSASPVFADTNHLRELIETLPNCGRPVLYQSRSMQGGDSIAQKNALWATFDARRAAGVRYFREVDQSFSSYYNNNPDSQHLHRFSIVAWDENGINPTPLKITLRLDMLVRFYDKADLPQS